MRYKELVPTDDIKLIGRKRKDLEREPAVKGEENRLSPFTIPNDEIMFDRAIGPLGKLTKLGSKKSNQQNKEQK